MGRSRVAMVVVGAILGAGGVAGASLSGGAVVTAPADRATARRTMSLVATGDWLPENVVNALAAEAAGAGVRYDHVPLLAPILPIVRSADLAICHMETPIGRPGDAAGFRGRAPNGRSLIAAPYEVAADLRRAGFDRCTTASNHAYDLGVDGIAATLEAFDAAGISHAGTARTLAEAEPDVIDVGGIRVGHVSFARNSNTGWPADAWRLGRLRSADDVVVAVRDLRRRGAEIVIVSLHVFVEMQSAPHPDDRAIVERFTRDAAVDLVLVHGPHVIQPVEVVHGATVFWSLGNFVSGMGVPGRGRYSDLRTLDGLMAEARITERVDGGFVVDARPVLLCQRSSTRVVHPGFAPSATPSDAGTSADVVACRARSVGVVAGLS